MNIFVRLVMVFGVWFLKVSNLSCSPLAHSSDDIVFPSDDPYSAGAMPHSNNMPQPYDNYNQGSYPSQQDSTMPQSQQPAMPEPGNPQQSMPSDYNSQSQQTPGSSLSTNQSSASSASAIQNSPSTGNTTTSQNSSASGSPVPQSSTNVTSSGLKKDEMTSEVLALKKDGDFTAMAVKRGGNPKKRAANKLKMNMIKAVNILLKSPDKLSPEAVTNLKKLKAGLKSGAMNKPLEQVVPDVMKSSQSSSTGNQLLDVLHAVVPLVDGALLDTVKGLATFLEGGIDVVDTLLKASVSSLPSILDGLNEITGLILTG